MPSEPVLSDAEVAAYAKWGDGPAWDLMTGEALTDPKALQDLLGKVRLTAATLAQALLTAREVLRVIVNAGPLRRVPTPYRSEVTTPELHAAFDAARKCLSGGA